MWDDGGVSGATNENARMPAEVSHTGTNAAIPSSGMIRCSSGFHRQPGGWARAAEPGEAGRAAAHHREGLSSLQQQRFFTITA